MASYDTHITGAAYVSIGTSVAIFSTGFFEFESLFLAIGCGLLGGIFPDVDSDSGRPVKIVFRLLTAILSFSIAVLILEDNFQVFIDYGWMPVMALWWFGYLLMNTVFIEIFKRFTKHRSIFHSILAAVVLQNLLVISLVSFTHWEAKEAVFAGFLFFVGYVTHLCLDEFHSIDFEGNKLKKSFGTALKLADFRGLDGYIKTGIFTALLLVTLGLMPNPNFADIKKDGSLTYLTQKNTDKQKFYDITTPERIGVQLIERSLPPVTQKFLVEKFQELRSKL